MKYINEKAPSVKSKVKDINKKIGKLISKKEDAISKAKEMADSEEPSGKMQSSLAKIQLRQSEAEAEKLLMQKQAEILKAKIDTAKKKEKTTANIEEMENRPITVLEGVMSDIHQMISNHKNFDSFQKEFFKEYGHKKVMKKTPEFLEWLEALYNDSQFAVAEADAKPGPDPYMRGLDDDEEEKKEDKMKKQAEMDDDDPDAYKELPGDKEAKDKGEVKTSKHVKKYHELYGDKKDESVVTEKLARGLKPLLKTGSTITKKVGEDALLDLSDKFDSIDDEYAGDIASHLDMAIELMQDGEAGAATKKLKQFNKACKDVLNGKEVGSAFESFSQKDWDVKWKMPKDNLFNATKTTNAINNRYNAIRSLLKSKPTELKAFDSTDDHPAYDMSYDELMKWFKTLKESLDEAEKYDTKGFKVGDKIKTNFGEWEVIETDYAPRKSFTAPFIFKGKDMKRVDIPNPPKTNKNAVGYKVTDGAKYPTIGFLYQYKDITKLATVGVDEKNVMQDDPEKFVESKNLKHINPLKFTVNEEKAEGDRGKISDAKIETALKTKAEETGVPIGLIRIVMRRGMAAWKTGHRPGATEQQWGYARVNAFLTKGDGTWGGADKDVAKEVRDGGHDKGLKERIESDIRLSDKVVAFKTEAPADEDSQSPNSITCGNCAWTWMKQDGGDDMYTCHKCGTENAPSLGESVLNEEDTYNDYPAAAKKNAKKALDWRDEHGREEVDAGTAVGWTRANQLAKGEKISADTIKRMASFNRHRKNSSIKAELKGTPWKDKGYVSWLIWGGDEGVDWAMKKSKELDNMKESKQMKYVKHLFEGKTLSYAKVSMLGSKVINKISIGTILDTKTGQYEITDHGRQSNAFKEFEAEHNGKIVKVKLTVMYGIKLEATDDVRSARFDQELELNSIILESAITEGIYAKKSKITPGEYIQTQYGYFYKRVEGKVGGQDAYVEIKKGKEGKRKTSIHDTVDFDIVDKSIALSESLVNEGKIVITKNEWPYLEFKDGSRRHKVEFDYEDIIDDHGNEGQDQYWVGKDDQGQEWVIDVYADMRGEVEEVHYDTLVKESTKTLKYIKPLNESYWSSYEYEKWVKDNGKPKYPKWIKSTLKEITNAGFMDPVYNSEHQYMVVWLSSFDNKKRSELLAYDKKGIKELGQTGYEMYKRFYNDLTGYNMFSMMGAIYALEVSKHIEDRVANGEPVEPAYYMMKEYFNNMGMDTKRSRIFNAAYEKLEKWMKENSIPTL